MASHLLPRTLALDTNVLIDLALQEPFAEDLRRGCRVKRIKLKIPPTVVQELVHMMRQGAVEKRLSAYNALIRARPEWDILPCDLPAVENGIAWEFSQYLIEKRLLPEEEVNDGLIVAETALANLSGLITSDSHLLDIEPTKLEAAFKERHLTPVTVYRAKAVSRMVT